MGIAALFMFDPKNYQLISFAYIESYLYHTLLSLIPILFILDNHKIKIKHLFYSIVTFAVLVIFVYGSNIYIGKGADYMFLVTVLKPSLVSYEMPFYPFFNNLMLDYGFVGSHTMSTLLFSALPVIGLLFSKIRKRGEIL